MFTNIKGRTGFTLIELLIVVAIIAILAAIAVPNFLEAQTRAKVSRVRADVRTVATAIETYKLDNNVYPPASESGKVAIPTTWPNVSSDFHSRIPSWITTPVAHLSSLPIDIFVPGKYSPPQPKSWDRYIYFNYDEMARKSAPGSLSSVQNQQTGGYLFYSHGPDKETNQPGAAQFKPGPNGTWTRYDATNGTVSWGNVIRTASSPEGEIPYNAAGSSVTNGPN